MLFFYKLHVDLCGSNEGRSSATTHKPLFRSLPEHCLFFARPVFRGGQTEQRRKGEMRWWLMVVVLVQRGMSRCVGRGEETPLAASSLADDGVEVGHLLLQLHHQSSRRVVVGALSLRAGCEKASSSTSMMTPLAHSAHNCRPRMKHFSPPCR